MQLAASMAITRDAGLRGRLAEIAAVNSGQEFLIGQLKVNVGSRSGERVTAGSQEATRIVRHQSGRRASHDARVRNN